MICLLCGNVNPEGSRYCNICGKALHPQTLTIGLKYYGVFTPWLGSWAAETPQLYSEEDAMTWLNRPGAIPYPDQQNMKMFLGMISPAPGPIVGNGQRFTVHSWFKLNWDAGKKLWLKGEEVIGHAPEIEITTLESLEQK